MIRRTVELARASIRRVVTRAQPGAILLGTGLVIWGVADFSTVLARILAGLSLIVFFGIEFGRAR